MTRHPAPPRPAHPDAAHPDAALIDRLQRTFDAALAEALGGATTPVALVNFPNHNNPGDSLIYLGAEASLRRQHIPIAYRCGWYNFSPAALAEADAKHGGRLPVLINGGGNFGDLYRGQQALRERLFQAERDRDLIQLPQSIHFRDPKNLDRNVRLVAEHGRVTLMLRDQASFELAGRHFDAPTLLSPDCAFGVGRLTLPRRRPADPSQPTPDILWLHRLPGDPEYVDYGIAAATAGLPYTVADVEWLETTPFEPRLPIADRLARRVNTMLRRAAQQRPRATARALAATFDRFGWSHVNRGLAVISSGRVLVTDKLHGHIMALEAGLPHVVLNNSYGKVLGAYETWTHPSTLTHLAESGAQAAELAVALLQEMDL